MSRLRRTDDGATAIIVALVTAFIAIGLAAFSADFGLAYTGKRNLQNGADAAALAAATQIIQSATASSSCAAVKQRYASDAAFRNQVTGVADYYSKQNRQDATRTTMTVDCSSSGDQVLVTYQNQATTPRAFGGLFTNSDYTATRSATAAVYVPGAGTGLRPYFLCLTSATALKNSTSPIAFTFPDTLCGNQPGNWYTADCPEDGGGNSNVVLASNTTYGCDSSINIVNTSSANGNSGLVNSLLVAACASGMSATNGCLTANTGNDMTSNNVQSAWSGLLNKTIGLPVFVPGTVSGNGNNARYPIYAIVGAKVCGYKWNSKSQVSTDPDCGSITVPTGNNNVVWLKFVSWQTSGSSVQSGCVLGGSCDLGARAIRLVS